MTGSVLWNSKWSLYCFVWWMCNCPADDDVCFDECLDLLHEIIRKYGSSRPLSVVTSITLSIEIPSYEGRQSSKNFLVRIVLILMGTTQCETPFSRPLMRARFRSITSWWQCLLRVLCHTRLSMHYMNSSHHNHVEFQAVLSSSSEPKPAIQDQNVSSRVRWDKCDVEL